MPTHPITRIADARDAPALAALRWEFRAAMAGETDESRLEFVERCTRWMAERLSGGSSWRCWVTEVEGEIVGHLWLQTVEKIPNPVPEPECHVYITNVFVTASFRGRGYAAELLNHALAFAREIEADSAILWPTELSRPLYERFGFARPPDLMQAVITPGRELH